MGCGGRVKRGRYTSPMLFSLQKTACRALGLMLLGQMLALAATTTAPPLDKAKIADYLRTHTFHTLVGDIKFGPNGEWTEPRVLEVQFHDVSGHDLDQFRTMGTQTVLYPPSLKTGTVRYPYSGGHQ